MTKEELLAKMLERQMKIPIGVPVSDYVLRCVEAMFDVAAEALADAEAKRAEK